jgi:hypothetical protein
MKWVLSHQSTDNHKWLLQDAPETAQFTYNLQNHSIRIKGKSSRLFFLEPSGFFQKKIVLRSEYGVVLAESPAAATKEGTLLMNDLKYFFQWENSQLSLFDKNKNLVSSVAIEAADEMAREAQAVLLFCHAWLVYASQHPKTREDLLVA